MKKNIILTAVVLLIAAAAVFTVKDRVFRRIILQRVKCGDTAVNFTLGMKGSATYSLDNYLGRKMIILSFSDISTQSKKFESELPASLSGYFGRQDIVWFNVRKESDHAVVEDFSSVDGLRYRTLYSSIPDYYSFSALPALVIIDKHGMIQFIYIGYSPTLYRDIRSWLEKIKK
jgi:hypothetical protein